MNPRKNHFSNQTNTDEHFWISERPNTMKLFSSSLFSQQHLTKGTALFIIGFHLLQTIALFIETSFYIFSIEDSEPLPFLGQIYNILLGRHFIEPQDINALQIVLIVVIIAYLISLTCLVIISILKYEKLTNFWITYQWKNIVQIHYYCVFLPLHNIIIETIIQALKPESESVWWFAIIFCLVELLNVGLCVLQFLSSVNIKSADPFCLLNEHFCRFSCVERAFISLMNLLIIQQIILDVSRLAVNLINLVLILIHIFLLFSTLPFYSMDTLKCFIFEAGAMLSITLTNLVFNPISDTISNYQGYFLLISLVITIMFFQIALNYIHLGISKTLMTVLDYISSNNTKETVNKFWFIQSIYYLKSLLEMDFYKPPEYCRYLESLLKNYGLIQHLNNFFSQINMTQVQFTSQNTRLVVFKLMELWRRNNRKEYLPRLVFADLMTDNLDLKLHEPYYISKELLSQHDLRLNTKLSALSIQAKIQKFIKNNPDQLSSGLNLHVFFERLDFWFNLKRKMAFQIGESLNLFDHIQDQNPDLCSFIDLEHKIRTYRKDVEILYERIPERIIRSNLAAMLVYSLYKIQINFEYKDGRACFERFKNLNLKKNELDKKDEITEETLLNFDNAIFIVETSKKDFGKIVFCSKNVKQIFKEEPNNLIGKQIEVLMPPFFLRIHQTMAMKKLDAAGNIIKTKFFQTFARNREGFIFPVNMVTSFYPSIEKGFYLSAIMRPIKTSLNYVLLDEDGYIGSYSEGLQYKLNLPLVLSETCVHILDLCANISDNEKYQSWFKICINGANETDDANLIEGESDFCPYNLKNSNVSRGIQTESSEEKILRMKWKIETKVYENRKLRVLTLEEVQLQSEQSEQGLGDDEMDIDVFPNEKIADTDNILVPNFNPLLSPNSSQARSLIDHQENRFSFANTSSRMMTKVLASTELTRISANRIRENSRNSQSLTKEELYLSRKLLKPTQNNLSEKSDDQKEKVKQKIQAEASITSKSSSGARIATDFQASIPTLRFYQFSQAKIPFACLIFSLLLLISSSFIVLNIATDTIPVIESNFRTLRTSLNRLVTLSVINMDLASMVFVKEILLCDACLSFLQPSLLPDVISFSEANLKITQSLNSLGTNFTEFTFARDIKIFTDNPDDFQLFSSVDAANMIADKGLHLALSTDYASAEFAGDLNFLTMNMFNDLLSHFQDEGTLISNEIVQLIDNAHTNSRTIFTITSVFCGVTILVLAVIYFKSYVDTKMFLETFMYFDQINIGKIQSQMKKFKKSLDSDFEDLYNELPSNTDFSYLIRSKNTNDKAPKTQRLAIIIFKRALVLLIFLSVPILITRVSESTFSSNFDSIAPNLLSIIKPKQVITEAMLALTLAGLYNARRDIFIKGQNISEVVDESIQNLPNLVTEDSLMTVNNNYDLFHQDYCQFIDPANYTTCEGLFNGAATTGLTGMILTLQANLEIFKKAEDLFEGFSDNYSTLVQNCLNMITFANDATNVVLAEGVEGLMADMKHIEKNIVSFIIISFVMCFVLCFLGAKYVYLYSTRERRNICKLMQIFPIEVIILNQRLRSFLVRDSSKVREVIHKFKQM